MVRFGGHKIIFWLCISVGVFFSLVVAGYCQGQCPAELLNKKVAVILGSGSPDVTSEVVKDVGALLESKLLNCGLQIIDQATVEKIIPEQEKQLILRGDTVGAVTLSEKLGADLLLAGQLTARVRSMEGLQTNLKSVYVTLSLKLLDAKTGQAISSKVWSGKSAGLEPSRAVISALEKQSDSLIGEIYQEYCQKGSSLISKESKEPSGRSLSSEEKQEKLPSIEGRHEPSGPSHPKETPEGGTAKPSSNLENL
ncbi:MAG: hypothetical protein WHS38_09815 [Thermodesulforhabdaceae bacterium]